MKYGGKTLGSGNYDVSVYTGDDIFIHHDTVTRVCVQYATHWPKKTVACYEGPSQISKIATKLNKMAIKDYGHFEQSRCRKEIKRNELIRSWCMQHGALDACVLHPDVDIVTLYMPSRSNEKDVRLQLIPMRMMQGDLEEYRILRHRSIPFVKWLTIGIDVLRLIAVIHAHGHVHADIKPNNILFDGSKRRDQRQQFVLCDYGIMSDVGSIVNTLGMSATMGTSGYMSPLITISDTASYESIHSIAYLSGLVTSEIVDDVVDWWHTYFLREIRRTGDADWCVYKLDLHSLALTLFRLFPRKATAWRPEQVKAALNVLCKLLFFRPNVDYRTAAQAHKALTKLRSSATARRK